MLLKSDDPTPTMIIEMGRFEFRTIIYLVGAMSWIAPSVRISKTM